jgi:hypothetical protein
MSTKRSTAKAVAAKQSRKPGRPTDYTPELAESFCAEVADGKSIREICARDDMPGKSTIMRWLARFEEFRDLYARAKELGSEDGYERIVDIERRMLAPKLVANAEFGHVDGAPKLIASPEYVDAHTGRSVIDSIKWRLSKLKPKVYGDRLELAGKVGTTAVVDQAPDWLKAAIRDEAAKTADAAAAQDEDSADPASTVH